jgi:methionyl-tRNA formyltransferase
MKIVVLTSSRFGTASDCLRALASSEACTVVGVVLSNGHIPDRRRHLVRKIKKALRIGPFGALNGVRMRKWYRSGASEDLFELCEKLNIPLHQVKRVNGPETKALFESFGADLGLSLGNPYISEKIFSIPRFGMLNVHGELLPDYQNAQSVIWPVYFGRTQTGVTIHQVDCGIDTGKILYREEFPIKFRARLSETVSQTIAQTRARTPGALLKVVENFHAFSDTAKAQPKGNPLTTPTLSQYLQMRKNNRVLHQAQRKKSES